jgi:hypothetical protein
MAVTLSRTGPVAILAAVALAVLWACEHSSPVQPEPPPACAFTLSTASLSFGASGGPASVTVTTGSSCAWTAVSDHAWMHVESGASGQGPGTVAVSLAANADPAVRTATLTVAGQVVAVIQAGAAVACTVAVSPASAAFSKDAAAARFTVSAPDVCTWHASSTDAWITVTSGADGTGTSMVGYAIAQNTSVDPRSGTIRVSDAAVSITQEGDTPAPACEFHVTPVQINACMSVSYELVTSVSTQPSCPWTVTSDTTWVTVSGATSRVGPGDIRFRIGDNYDAPRLGVVKVRWDTPTAGQNVQVSQAGCRYAVSTASMNVPAGGGSFTFDVYQQSDPLECGGPLQNGCVWSAVADASWVTVSSSMPKSGDDRVSFSVAPNGGAPRTARIALRDKVVLVAQDGR